MQETIRALPFHPNKEISESVFGESPTGNESQQQAPSQEMPFNQLNDYHLNHPDINEAKKLEEYFNTGSSIERYHAGHFNYRGHYYSSGIFPGGEKAIER